MKKFNDSSRMTEILAHHGAFFAFSNRQYDEHAEPGVEYTGLFSGLICPKDQAPSLIANLDLLHQEKIAWELENNSKKDIIWYQLANHECQIVGSYSEVIELLEPYGITVDDIKAEWRPYWDNCVENNYF